MSSVKSRWLQEAKDGSSGRTLGNERSQLFSPLESAWLETTLHEQSSFIRKWDSFVFEAPSRRYLFSYSAALGYRCIISGVACYESLHHGEKPHAGPPSTYPQGESVYRTCQSLWSTILKLIFLEKQDPFLQEARFRLLNKTYIVNIFQQPNFRCYKLTCCLLHEYMWWGASSMVDQEMNRNFSQYSRNSRLNMRHQLRLVSPMHYVFSRRMVFPRRVQLSWSW